MPRTCLIAEADLFIARLLARFSEENDLTAVQIQVGQDILEQAQQLLPSVIILDPELPGKVRGWEIARQLRQQTATSAIPLVLCAWMKPADTARMVGSEEIVLQKPDLFFEDFVEALRQAGVETGRHQTSTAREPYGE